MSEPKLDIAYVTVPDDGPVHDEEHLGDVSAMILAGGMGDLKVVSRLRKSDIIARYGGEEFVVILPETSPHNAGVAAEKMRGTIEAEMIAIDGQEVSVTMSFGVAGLSPEIQDTEGFIRRADYAMYRAKQNGRNRVEIFSENEYDRSHTVHA